MDNSSSRLMSDSVAGCDDLVEDEKFDFPSVHEGLSGFSNLRIHGQYA